MKKTIYSLFLMVFIFACSSDNSDDSTPTDDDTGEIAFSRAELLESWADTIIIPSYEAFTASLGTLNSALDTFVGDPNEVNLVALRTAWQDTYFVWQRVSMFETGPAESINYRLNINVYPTDVDQIEINVFLDENDLNLDLPSNRDAKGLPALDYLLNGLANTDAEIIAIFNGPNGNNYLTYTTLLVQDMTDLTDQVLSAWQGGFRDDFVNNDGSSANASADRYINDYIEYYERFLRAGKMGIPAGVFSGSVIPENLEARFKGDISNALFLEGLDAVQDFFNGIAFGSTTNGIGLDDYLMDLDAQIDGQQLSTAINNQYNVARTAVSNLGSFQSELEVDPPIQMLLAYDEVQRIVPLIKVDMLSFLNINVDFQDADGD